MEGEPVKSPAWKAAHAKAAAHFTTAIGCLGQGPRMAQPERERLLELLVDRASIHLRAQKFASVLADAEEILKIDQKSKEGLMLMQSSKAWVHFGFGDMDT